MMEIERKFLVNELPAGVNAGSGKRILQGYLMAGDDAELRIRRMGRKYFLNSKNGSGLKREEKEAAINQSQFDLLWPACSGRSVEKERHIIKVENGFRAEVDLYAGILEGLQLAEVEFPDIDKANQFQPPFWFGPEVTNDIRFSNQRLASYDQDNLPSDLRNVLVEARHSVGAIPVMQFNGINHLVVVSTRNNMRWIFPKGNPKSGMEDGKMAEKEALEEAGVTGTLFGSPVPVHYWKGFAHYIIDYYPMLVSALHTEWEEKEERQRRICPFEEAAELLSDPLFVLAMKHSIEELGAN